MKLDKRIIESKRPLTCIDVEQAREFEGKLCLFSDNYRNYKDIQDYAKNPQYTGILTVVSDKQEYPFRNDNDGYCYMLVLPYDWVEPKEEKYRAYTLEEFIGAMNLGGLEPWIRMRPVGSNKECKFLYTGYQETEAGEYICLGCFQFDFVSLFKNYEIQDINGKWHPFGVKE